MARIIDQIRASKLPSNMMQFAARGALQVSAAENIEILVYLARNNKVFGETARLTLAGWDERSCLAVAADPQSPADVLNYFISPDNVRPSLLPALLENPAVREPQLVKLASTALRDTLEIMLKSKRIRSLRPVIEAFIASPYLRKEEAQEFRALLSGGTAPSVPALAQSPVQPSSPKPATATTNASQPSPAARPAQTAPSEPHEPEAPAGPEDETVSSYLTEHAEDIAAEAHKPFQAIGGSIDLLGANYFPVIDTADASAPEPPASTPAAASPAAAAPATAPSRPVPKPNVPPKRENTLQKINALDVKGRIQLALKGNKEERSILIRDGTKVVALAVLEAPKLSDGEVEKFASQKNVLEAVLRQIPLKRRFIKNYIVVRNLVANPRTPLDLGLGLMKNLLTQDLKNLSTNKEVSETIRNLAGKMYKQKLDVANRK